MLMINYPKPDFRLKTEHGKELIFDIQRKKWVMLTPEEWVRQNFIQYLIKEKKYPLSFIALEKEIMLGELKKRFDILVYNKDHRPWMLVECKAPDVDLDEKVFDQVLRYHISIPCNFLVITNGVLTFGWGKKDENLLELIQFPEWA